MIATSYKLQVTNKKNTDKIRRGVGLLITTTTQIERKNGWRLPTLLHANDDVKQIVWINDPGKKLKMI